ncbi:hypothetical protein [Pseudomonas aeruginosa]|uniref:hypothetical protein n=1 Tax=Pseudomonas aeruginosa TaxID=287 RepID=UPI003CF81B70
MTNELTDVRCPCGTEFPAESYDAGFIAGSGMCQNCDAALPPKDICTCPSGNGSLRHPCPAHPAVEQAGGDERDFQAEGAQEVPSPVSQEYDRHLISLLRKGEALPGHQEEAADEIERLRDWNDHLNNTVLPNILNPTFLMLMKGGERLLDLCTKDGEFIGVSLNDMKDVFDWMVTHARIAPDQAALAQPSHAPELAERGTQHRFSTTEQTCRHDFAGVWWNDNGETKTGRECRHCGFFVADVTKAQAEQAEAERPEVVAWRYGFSGGIVSDKACLDEWKSGGEYQSLMTVAQHERIVGALRAEIAEWQEAAGRGRSDVVAYIAERAKLLEGRDAALARVAELEAKLSDPTAVHQWQFSNAWFDGSEEVVLKAGKEGSPIRTLYAAPVAQAQPEETPGEILAAKLIETWVTEHGKPAPWSTAVEITAVATNMPNDERDRLLALDDDVDAQAQHSVPDDVETFLDEVRAELLRARSKFPGDRIMTIALAEEFGELCKAVLDEPAANVRKEAVQTAVMAARVVLDGDGSVTAWRAERGLDPLASAPGKEGL